jgi:hypothetical protein
MPNNIGFDIVKGVNFASQWKNGVNDLYVSAEIDM